MCLVEKCNHTHIRRGSCAAVAVPGAAASARRSSSAPPSARAAPFGVVVAAAASSGAGGPPRGHIIRLRRPCQDPDPDLDPDREILRTKHSIVRIHFYFCS